jgi:photosystem II stability/assembly factor-like uncharacterized protein
LPANTGSLHAVACANASTCTAVGMSLTGQGALLVTGKGGTTWTDRSQYLPIGVTSMTGVSCPSASVCVASGQFATAAGVMMRTSDGGQKWRRGTLPKGVYEIDAVACSTSSSCVGVGQSSSFITSEGIETGGAVVTSTNEGASWTGLRLPARIGPLTGVSCYSGLDCLSVGWTADGTPLIATNNGS